MEPEARAYILGKASGVAEAVAANVQRDLTYVRPTKAGGHYLVVGAGPSLNQTGHLLPKYREAGYTIITVNTALPAVSKYLAPDYVVARELVDVSTHLDHPSGHRLLDIGVNPTIVEKSLSLPGRTSFFIPCQTHYTEMAAALGVRPIYGGTTAITAAVAIAQQWGADSITLLGVDLGRSSDGQGYALGSAFSDYRISEDGKLSGNGLEVKKTQHQLGNTPPPPKAVALTEVPGWGGGTAQLINLYEDQLEWLQEFPSRDPRMTLIDSTGAGVSKGPGWQEILPGELLGPSVWPTGLTCFSKGNTQAATTRLRKECDIAESICLNVTHQDGFFVGNPELMHGIDLVDLRAAAGLLLALDSGLSVEEKVRVAYEDVIPEAVATFRKLLS